MRSRHRGGPGPRTAIDSMTDADLRSRLAYLKRSHDRKNAVQTGTTSNRRKRYTRIVGELGLDPWWPAGAPRRLSDINRSDMQAFVKTAEALVRDMERALADCMKGHRVSNREYHLVLSKRHEGAFRRWANKARRTSAQKNNLLNAQIASLQAKLRELNAGAKMLPRSKWQRNRNPPRNPVPPNRVSASEMAASPKPWIVRPVSPLGSPLRTPSPLPAGWANSPPRPAAPRPAAPGPKSAPRGRGAGAKALPGQIPQVTNAFISSLANKQSRVARNIAIARLAPGLQTYARTLLAKKERKRDRRRWL